MAKNIIILANGNIKTLKRNGVTNGNGSNAMDDFTYQYNPSNNQLKKVTDVNDNPDATRYNDLKSQGDDNYIYNNIGQLVISKQDKALYKYNTSGLVSKVNEFSSTASSEYYSLLLEDYESLNLPDLVWNSTGSLPRVVQAH